MSAPMANATAQATNAVPDASEIDTASSDNPPDGVCDAAEQSARASKTMSLPL